MFLVVCAIFTSD